MDRSTTYLASKPRYEILDALRGVAAILVVCFHLFETYSRGPQYQILNHGYLAVDFFFVLSGFVIGYAYDDRWNKMNLKNFFKRRLIRLHPMVIFGSFLGLLLFYFAAGISGEERSAFRLINETPWWLAILIFLMCCTMIPVPIKWDIRGWSETNPLDGPAWTLLWEYIGNILYALIFRHLSKKALGVCVAFFAVLTIMLCMNIDVFGVLEQRKYAAYTVIGGWCIDATNLLIGSTRLLYPFFMGLFLSRVNKLIHLERGGFYWCALLIFIMFAMPRVGGPAPENWWMNGIYDAFCILIMFPLIVSIGAGSTVTGGKTMAICKFLGDISYPLYITHHTLVYIQIAWRRSHLDAPLSMHIFMGVSIFILSIGIAYAAYKLYDMPVREWLKNKLFKKVDKPQTVQ